MRGRLRSASRSDTRPPQRWQRPTKTRDPNWHRAGSGSTRVRMEAGREATTTCWAWQAEPEGNTRIPIRCRGGQLADGRLRKERSKSQNLSKKGKTTKTRAAWASRWSATRRQEKPAKTGVFSLTRAGLLMEDAEERSFEKDGVHRRDAETRSFEKYGIQRGEAEERSFEKDGVHRRDAETQSFENTFERCVCDGYLRDKLYLFVFLRVSASQR